MTLVDPPRSLDLGDPSLAIVDCRSNLNDPEWGAREYDARTFPAPSSSTSIATCPARRPAPTAGIRCRIRPCSRTRSSGSASTRTCRSSPTIRTPGCTQAVSGGCCAGWATKPPPSSTVASPSGSPRPARAGGTESRPARRFAGAPRSEWRRCRGGGRSAGRRAGCSSRACAGALQRRIETIDRGRPHPGRRQLLLQEQRGRRRGVPRAGGAPPPARDGWRHAADRVVCYCGSGVTACQNLLALEHVGLPGARLYAGRGVSGRAIPLGPEKRPDSKAGPEGAA